MKVALYARVSTKDQKNDMQLTELRAWAKRAGYTVIEYIETASSVKHRPVFEQMMADARAHKFELILVWKIDRLARSMKNFIDITLQLSSWGVGLTAITQNISTTHTDPMGQFVLKLFALLAELERAIIVERTKAGVAEAKRQGKHCGRPSKVFDRAQAAQLRTKGYSWRAIATKMKVDQSVIRRALAKTA